MTGEDDSEPHHPAGSVHTLQQHLRRPPHHRLRQAHRRVVLLLHLPPLLHHCGSHSGGAHGEPLREPEIHTGSPLRPEEDHGEEREAQFTRGREASVCVSVHRRPGDHLPLQHHLLGTCIFKELLGQTGI